MMEKVYIVDSKSPEMKKVFKLRHDVFVKEQSVPPDMEVDEHDSDAVHLAYKQNTSIVGVLRIVEGEKNAKIGRVAVKKTHRGKGIGKLLIKKAIDLAKKGGHKVAMLESQVHATEFYKKLGFVPYGEIFMDAGIPHIKMKKALV